MYLDVLDLIIYNVYSINNAHKQSNVISAHFEKEHIIAFNYSI